MSADNLVGYLDCKEDCIKDSHQWTERFCVLCQEDKLFKVFTDEEGYRAEASPLSSPTEYKPVPRQAWISLMEDPSKSPPVIRRGRSQSLVKITDLHKKVKDGMRRTKSNSISSSKPVRHGDFSTEFGVLSNDHLIISRSQESLSDRRSSIVDSMDLSVSGKVSVRSIHPSILHRQFCFQVMSPNEHKYFSCRSADELNAWINSIKKSIQPTRDKQHRTDIGVTLWILDAKGLTMKPKKRYYCEVLLDKNLFSRTTAKTKTESLFWGESFVFDDLPDFAKLSVNIYKESESKNKKGKRKLIGNVDVLVEELDNNQETEKWFPVTLATSKTANGETPSIRLKIKYQRVCILPIKAYSEILSYIKDNYMSLCDTMESAVSSKVKDEIAGVILRVLEPVGKAREFLVNIVMNEVNKLADENLIFRGNSFATKAMDTYMKMVGESYLQETLSNFIVSVYTTNEDCEVDPSKSTSGNLEAKRENLKSFVEKAWLNIENSSQYFPGDLQETFHKFKERCVNRNKDLSNNLISSSIFLRFLCPAILSPSLFHLVQEYPNEKTSRTLTLIAKVIQNLANFTRFGGKEEYMGFMNEFVESTFDSMKTFLETISTHPERLENHFDAGIDHGRELSVLYTTLREQMSKLDQESKDKLGSLQIVLDKLEDAYRDFNADEIDSLPPKKWASSSDLVSEDHDDITFTPVHKSKRLDESPTPGRKSLDYRTAPRKSHRMLPTPGHLVVDPKDIIVASPSDLESRRFSSPILSIDQDKQDLSSTISSSHLRRHSYLNAVNDEISTPRRFTETNAIIEQNVRKMKLGSHQRSRSDVESADSLSSGEGIRTPSKREISRHLSEEPGRLSRQRPWSLAIDTPSRGLESSPRPRASPVVTERFRTLPVNTASPRTSRKASPLAIIDTITRGPTERDSDHSSPASSPIPKRRTPQPSPKLLRAHSENKTSLKYIARSPSATSSSSSGSSGSWRGSSFGSGSTDRGRRRHVLPSTPSRYSPTSNRSNSTSGPRTEEDNRDYSTSRSNEEKLQELSRELQETKKSLASTREQLILQESSTHVLVASIKERLAETEKSLKKMREEKERDVKDLLDRLVNMETEAAKEREDMQEMLQAKQLIIEAQEKRIKSLDATNSRLVITLNQIKLRDKLKLNKEKLEIEETRDEFV